MSLRAGSGGKAVWVLRQLQEMHGCTFPVPHTGAAPAATQLDRFALFDRQLYAGLEHLNRVTLKAETFQRYEEVRFLKVAVEVFLCIPKQMIIQILRIRHLCFQRTRVPIDPRGIDKIARANCRVHSVGMPST